MARTPENFSHNNQLATSPVTIIEAVPANIRQVVRKLSFRNTGSSTRVVSVFVVQPGGSAATSNELQVKGIPAGKEWSCILIQAEVFTEGMSLQASQDSGTDVNINCSGVTVS